jgi:hypothetical protein
MACFLLTAAELASMLAEGWTQVGGPFASESTCVANCTFSSCDGGGVDHGCGQQGWLMGDDGIWAWDGEISCTCGTPNYPTFGSPPGDHTTTYCCP